jgi:hypothetical protein
MRCLLLVLALLLLPVLAAAQGCPTYGGDAGGQRYSAAGLITRANVHLLAPAWTFHTGERPRPGPHGMSFEDTPILADGQAPGLHAERPGGRARPADRQAGMGV